MLNLSYNTWTYIALGAAAVFAIVTILLIIFRFLKNRYYHEYHKDELIKKTRTVNSRNKLYFTAGETTHYIRKYVVCRTSSDKYLIVNYNKSFKRISYYVIQYGLFKRVISVLKCVELDTGEASKIIALKRRCRMVNIVVNSADDTTVNNSVIKPITKTRTAVYALLKGLQITTFLFAIRHVIIYFMAGLSIKYFLNSEEDVILIVGILAVGILYWIFTYSGLRRKNTKKLQGGVIEYEFL